MQNRVFVLDTNKQPLMPCHPARARELLSKGKASVFRRHPFTIILKRTGGATQPVRVKVDPGAKTSGIAITMQTRGRETVVWAAELQHRGWRIKDALERRRSLRRGRRNRKTRYRAPRFNNRTRHKGWLPPSLMSRVYNIMGLVDKVRRFSPVTALSVETVRFDTQKLTNPGISGVEYQQGTLYGYEIREYLLEKFERKCVYCGKENVPLEVEHVRPKSKGGSDSVTNLVLACRPCNQRKGNKPLAEFVKDAEKRKKIEGQLRRPLRDTATVNATRWEIWRRLSATGLPVEMGTGGRTKYNRRQLGLPKAHFIDAACVGESGVDVLCDPAMQVLVIAAKGHGTRQRVMPDKYGFPKQFKPRQKRFFGFQSGDVVRGYCSMGKNKGWHEGRVSCRTSGSFSIKRTDGTVIKAKHDKCIVLHRYDGYDYKMDVPVTQEDAARAARRALVVPEPPSVAIAGVAARQVRMVM